MATFYFLVPTAQVTIGGDTVTAPEYFSTDLAGLAFTTIPFGAEGLVLLALKAPNNALSAEADVFTFPTTDLTAVLADADVASLTDYLGQYNVPTSQISAGQTYAQVLRQLAQIFLAAQYAAGQNGGQSLFTLQAVQPGKHVSTPSAALTVITPGVFDFSNENPDNSIADTLLAAASQFTDPIHIGGGSL